MAGPGTRWESKDTPSPVPPGPSPPTRAAKGPSPLGRVEPVSSRAVSRGAAPLQATDDDEPGPSLDSCQTWQQVMQAMGVDAPRPPVGGSISGATAAFGGGSSGAAAGRRPGAVPQHGEPESGSGSGTENWIPERGHSSGARRAHAKLVWAAWRRLLVLEESATATSATAVGEGDSGGDDDAEGCRGPNGIDDDAGGADPASSGGGGARGSAHAEGGATTPSSTPVPAAATATPPTTLPQSSSQQAGPLGHAREWRECRAASCMQLLYATLCHIPFYSLSQLHLLLHAVYKLIMPHSVQLNLAPAIANTGAATANMGAATANTGAATANTGAATANMAAATANTGAATADPTLAPLGWQPGVEEGGAQADPPAVAVAPSSVAVAWEAVAATESSLVDTGLYAAATVCPPTTSNHLGAPFNRLQPAASSSLLPALLTASSARMQLLLSGGGDGGLKLWSRPKPRMCCSLLVAVLRLRHAPPPRLLALLVDGALLLRPPASTTATAAVTAEGGGRWYVPVAAAGSGSSGSSGSTPADGSGRPGSTCSSGSSASSRPVVFRSWHPLPTSQRRQQQQQHPGPPVAGVEEAVDDVDQAELAGTLLRGVRDWGGLGRAVGLLAPLLQQEQGVLRDAFGAVRRCGGAEGLSTRALGIHAPASYYKWGSGFRALGTQAPAS